MNESLLFENNKFKNYISYKIIDKRIQILIKEKTIDHRMIKNIISLVFDIEKKYSRIKNPITIILKKVEFKDKLTIILFESICNHIIVQCKRNLKIQMSVRKGIATHGISSSVLQLLNGEKHIDKFVKQYNFDLYQNHYRRIIHRESSKESDILSKTFSEINTFFKPFNVDPRAALEVSEFLIELLGNAKEHTDSDCLIDLDVTPADYLKRNDQSIDYENLYYGINIAVVNFSENLLGDGIQKIIMGNTVLEDRYKKVQEAYEYHKKYFNDDYMKEDFFNIAAYQHKISGREKIVETGGTGLTKLISSLEKKADSHQCYVLSGNRGIFFKQEYLEYNDDRWIGFNDKNNFISDIPNPNLLFNSDLFIPGTAYNLSFVMRKEN